ncbi:MAG: hypothetical protein WCI73_09970, partial [Phycisphaerae bacterium]
VVIGYLSHDPDPQNPRENDNLGVMACWHRRYNLGDQHDHKAPQQLWASLLGEEYEQLYEASEAEFTAWLNAHPDISYGTTSCSDYINESDRQLRQQVQERLTARGYVILPLYLYDHSGITISTGSFGDIWDSGQVGYIYAGPEEAKKLGAKPGEIEKCLQGEVKEYDRYLRGECYGVCVEVFGADGEHLEDDACWNFLGTEYAQQEVMNRVGTLSFA